MIMNNFKMNCSQSGKYPTHDYRESGKVSLRLVYVCAFVLFFLQIVSFYSSYVYYSNLDHKYEIWYRQLESRIDFYKTEVFRRRRDIGVQDNAIPKSIDDSKSEIVENDVFKNESISSNEYVYSNSNNSDENLVWLNKYSRVPLKLMQEFCKVTHENCPTQKGDPGIKGNAGERGEKGDTGKDGADGQTGKQGLSGPRGPPGIKGDRGEKGERGMPGLDGRPGIPGEPGLDGVPGRHGKDGVLGKNGEPGEDGQPGTPGIPGMHGTKGEKGDRGSTGPIGPTGLPGKQGKTGNAGLDGTPGIPGITAYSYSNNGTKALLIPPTIIGSDPKHNLRNITVKEYKKIKLRCSSTGEPKPKNIWRGIENGRLVPVIQGQWGMINEETDTLSFMNISRHHMGEYMCFADNGVPPTANVTYYLNVFFPPYIEIENVIFNVTLGGTAHLECRIQAYPHGVYYWEDSNGVIYEETQGNFHVDYEHIGLYETILQLNITNVRKRDLGIYYCVGKNEEGITRGYINVTDEPGSKLQVTDICHRNRVKFGNPGPPAEGELCPECPRCKICGFGYRDLEIRIIQNKTFSPLRKAQSCEMETIGKPVYHNSFPNLYGSWMREAYLDYNDCYWITLENCTSCLYEYANKTAFTYKSFTKLYDLKVPFIDNDHIIYNGSFYYATKKNEHIAIIRYDLDKETILDSVILEYCDTSPLNYLYKTEHNHVDVMSDDNGLWAVCAMRRSNNTVITKFNMTYFSIEKAWNISVKHQDAGDMFIICGILYAVNSVKDYETSISLALDLYSEKLLDDVSIKFTNPFFNTSMISYNHRFKELYTWDNGNMLTYPIKCQDFDFEIPTNETIINKSQNISHEEIIKKS